MVTIILKVHFNEHPSPAQREDGRFLGGNVIAIRQEAMTSLGDDGFGSPFSPLHFGVHFNTRQST